MVNNALVSMKVSASWEAEKSSSNVIPRLCSLSLIQVVLDCPIEPENTNSAFYVVVRMRESARRVLRSPEITLITPTSQSNLDTNTDTTTSSGLLSTSVHGVGSSVPIDFTCNIQYSHQLTRNANILQILLQRRKKYKSKTMNFGYKTLAYCNVDLAQILQRRIENRFLELFPDPKCKTQSVGRIEVNYLSSSPLDKDLLNGKRKVLDEDEDDAIQDVYSEPDDSDRGEESDEDPIAECEEVGHHSRPKKIVKAMSVGQNQFKQKLIGLLRKLKIGDPNEVDLDVATTWDDLDCMATASDIEDESDGDCMDLVSIQTTPRPTLRPFYATTGSSDDTLSADAGTKLLKRFQKEFMVDDQQSSTANRPNAAKLCAMLQSVGSAKPAPVDKKNASPLTGPSTDHNSAGLKSSLVPQKLLQRGGGGGGRFVKRLAHIRRRSNNANAGIGGSGVKRDGKSTAGQSPTLLTTLTTSRMKAGRKSNSFTNTTETEHGTMENESSDDLSPIHSNCREHADTSATHTELSRSFHHQSPNHCVGSPVCISTPNSSRMHRSEVRGMEDDVVDSVVFSQHHHDGDLFGEDDLDVEGDDVEDGDDDASNALVDVVQQDDERFDWTNDATDLMAKMKHYGGPIYEDLDVNLPDLESLANVVFLINLSERGSKYVLDLFSGLNLRVHPVSTFGETRLIFNRLTNEAQALSRRPVDHEPTTSSPDVIRICLLGGDGLVNAVLRAYVDQLSARTAELTGAFRFFIVPVTGLCRQVFQQLQADCVSPPTSQKYKQQPSVPSSKSAPNGVSNKKMGHEGRPKKAGKMAGDLLVSTEGGPLNESNRPNTWNNSISNHLCYLDSTYATLFADWCRNSPSIPDCGPFDNSTAPTIEWPSSNAKKSIQHDFFNRIRFYLSHCSQQQFVAFPIGSCLLGTITPNATVGNKFQKLFFDATHVAGQMTSIGGTTSNPAACTSPNAVANTNLLVGSSASSEQSDIGGKATGADVYSSNEEMVIPFILNVKLGNDSNPTWQPSAGRMSKPQRQSAIGTDVPLFNQSDSEFQTINGDLELNLVQQQHQLTKVKRHYSPEARNSRHCSLSSPRCPVRRTRFYSSHGFTHLQPAQLLVGPDQRLWDLQIEYWSIPNAALNNTSLTSGANPANNSTTGTSVNAMNISSHNVEVQSPPRRSTMKTICPGLVVSMAASRVMDATSNRLLMCSNQNISNFLTMALWSKEKKQKIMLIGRKGKEFGCRYEQIYGIQRLLCTGRGCNLPTHTNAPTPMQSSNNPTSTTAASDHHHRGRDLTEYYASNTKSTDVHPYDHYHHHHPVTSTTTGSSSTPSKLAMSNSISALGLSFAGNVSNSNSQTMTVWIDGVKWSDLKFFQITPVWRTHVKVFPIALLSNLNR